MDITLTAHQHVLESTLALRGGGVLFWIPIRSLVARLWDMKAFHSLAVRIRGHERLSFYASTKITAEHSSLMSLSRFLLKCKVYPECTLRSNKHQTALYPISHTTRPLPPRYNDIDLHNNIHTFPKPTDIIFFARIAPPVFDIHRYCSDIPLGNDVAGVLEHLFTICR